jgi:Tol biopolymer transport system component
MNLWRTDVDGSPPVQVTSGSVKDFKASFSRDGRYLAFHSALHKGGQHTLSVMTWPDGKPRQPVALREKEWIHGPFWAADGRHVLIHGRLAGVDPTRLYKVNVVTGEMTPVPVPGFRTSGHGSWDRAEKVMAFDGSREVPGSEPTR